MIINNNISDLERRAVCLQAWSVCSGESMGGNVFSWESGQVRSQHMEEHQQERRTVCSQEKLTYLAFPTKRNFLETQSFCRTLTGDIAVTTGPESVNNIQKALDNIGGSLVGPGSHFTLLNLISESTFPDKIS